MTGGIKRSVGETSTKIVGVEISKFSETADFENADSRLITKTLRTYIINQNMQL